MNVSQKHNSQPQQTAPQADSKPKAPPIGIAPAPIINIYRWRNKRFAGEKVGIGKHTVTFDEKGWAPQDLPREVDAILAKMSKDEATKKGYEKLVLNQDNAWDEDIAAAEDEIAAAHGHVDHCRGLFADANIALARAKAKLEGIKRDREHYKLEVERTIAEAEAAVKSATG